MLQPIQSSYATFNTSFKGTDNMTQTTGSAEGMGESFKAIYPQKIHTQMLFLWLRLRVRDPQNKDRSQGVPPAGPAALPWIKITKAASKTLHSSWKEITVSGPRHLDEDVPWKGWVATLDRHWMIISCVVWRQETFSRHSLMQNWTDLFQNKQ